LQHYAASSERLVINLSLGAKDSYSSAVANAISAAMSDGAIVVAAAGNYGPAEPMFPASLPKVIAASASDRYDLTDYLTYFTQYGDIAAPGEYIYSTWNDATSVSYPWPVCIGAGEVECYKYESGTSMASPFVAAAAGLVWSIHPEYTPLQVRFALYGSVDVPAGWDSRYGVGRLNVGQAVTGPPVVVHWIYLPLAVR
ncbi:MAG: S8 family serine peptidase, partial [Anaerolineae bacterium]